MVRFVGWRSTPFGCYGAPIAAIVGLSSTRCADGHPGDFGARNLSGRDNLVVSILRA